MPEYKNKKNSGSYSKSLDRQILKLLKELESNDPKYSNMSDNGKYPIKINDYNNVFRK